ncbi:Rieske (2Fe-2S) protein [Halopseudomonas bauzanensis]|nr:Rieske (2Fe-2S) protein [Halopseudomonas bauzanensis]
MSAKAPLYLMNAWYVAALASEVGPEELFGRTLLDVAVLLYRKKEGTAVAMRDRCPHRFVPLSMGRREGDDVVCAYHGLKFDCTGQCSLNPHGDGHIPKAARVQSFPLLERYGFLWIWMGDQPADESLLPNFGYLTEGHPNGVGYTYMRRECNYELITDNVMDLSHVDHLHGESITTRGQLSPKPPKLVENGRLVSARWEWSQTPPIQILAGFLSEPTVSARHFVQVSFTPPANIQLSIGATQADGELELNLESCVGQYDLHTSTPETVDTTHYFFGTRRNHKVEDAEFNQLKTQAMHEAFDTEDGPMLDAQHRAMESTDLLSLNPVLLTSDAAPVRVRRLMRKLIEQDQGLKLAQTV